MRQLVILALASLVAVLFAGCAGGAGAPANTAQPSSVVQASGEPIADAGTLTVVVVDDAVSPIQDAEVALVELTLVARTDEAGSATFTNVPPGTYTVAAQKLGFSSAAKKQEILAEQEHSLTMTLVPVAVSEPYSEILGPFEGYFDCRLGGPALTGPCVPVGAANPNDKSDFRFKMHETTLAFVGEMTWSQGSFATSQQLRLSFSHDQRTSSHWFCTATSGSPIRWTYVMEEGCLARPYCGIGASQGTSGSQPAEPTPKLNLMVYVNTPFSCPNAGAPVPDTNNLHPLELALQQRFRIWVTMFQDMLPPEGYTALPDA